MSNQLSEYDDVAERLDASWDEQDGPVFLDALGVLRRMAESGNLEAAEFLAEILARQGPNHDAAAAYKWYFIVFSRRGYSVAFRDINGFPPAYGGPDGDFRNEAQVSDLVSELGFARVVELDIEATAWLRSQGLSAPE